MCRQWCVTFCRETWKASGESESAEISGIESRREGAGEGEQGQGLYTLCRALLLTSSVRVTGTLKRGPLCVTRLARLH